MLEGNLLTDHLQSEGHFELLDTIDELRSHGVSRYVDLPQIIVCGDQSSGKSSVLEAISGVRFPTKDNLCTLFATELILRHGTERKMNVSIDARHERSEEENKRLSEYGTSVRFTNEFTSVIEGAKAVMGLGQNGRTFSNDVLKIELSGPDQPNLTLVDLPGLFHASSKQQSTNDRELVQKLVRGYMENPRSIILAVVSAQYDKHNQIVTEMTQEFDSNGDRTLGIITKPDTLPRTSESEKAFVELANNRDVHFRLGWHVLKNRDYENRDCTLEERNQQEAAFFSGGIWQNVPALSLGIETLKPRLSAVLRDQIVQELPSLLQDVRNGIEDCKIRLSKLGDPRKTQNERRSYLSRVSNHFSGLLGAALDGNYFDKFFGDACTNLGYSKRLRAVVQNHLQNFAKDISNRGHKRAILDDVQPRKNAINPPQISRADYISHVQKLLHRSRGKELLGTFNPLLIGDLFFEQAQPWEQIMLERSEKILAAVKDTLVHILEHTTEEATKKAVLREIINPHLKQRSIALKTKMTEILRPHVSGHPITYNHYFTETIQNVKKKREETQLRSALSAITGKLVQLQDKQTSDIIDSFVEHNERDMDRYACSLAVDCMEAYYKVALKTFVDNFATLAIEHTLLDDLPSMFSTLTVTEMEDDIVTSIASESRQSQAERARVTHQLQSLERGMRILNKLEHAGTGRWSLSLEDIDDEDDESSIIESDSAEPGSARPPLQSSVDIPVTPRPEPAEISQIDSLLDDFPRDIAVNDTKQDSFVVESIPEHPDSSLVTSPAKAKPNKKKAKKSNKVASSVE